MNDPIPEQVERRERRNWTRLVGMTEEELDRAYPRQDSPRPEPPQAAPPSPTMLDVLQGVGRWWLADPATRRINVCSNAADLEVVMTLLGEHFGTHRIKFAMPVSAEFAHEAMVEAAAFMAKNPHTKVTVIRNPAYRQYDGEDD